MLHAESLLLQLPGSTQIKQEPSSTADFYHQEHRSSSEQFYGQDPFSRNSNDSLFFQTGSPLIKSEEASFYSHADVSPPAITEFGAKIIVPPQANGSRSSSVGSGSTGSTGSSRRKSYSCDRCPAMFGSKMELEEHSNSHTGDKPFECDVCNARFNRRSTLWNHKRIHSDAKPFKCPICCMHFKWKNSLKCHKEMHLRKNETGPLDAEEFRIQLLSPSKRGRTARGGSRKRGGSASAAASSISVSPLVNGGHHRAGSPDFSMLEDPTGYSATTLMASQDAANHQTNGHHPPPSATSYDPMAHHDGRMGGGQRAPSILQQALQQPVSPALSLAVQSPQQNSSYQIYVQSLPMHDSKPPAPPSGLLQPATSTYSHQGMMSSMPPASMSQGMKLSPPSGTTPMHHSRGESPIASGGQVPSRAPAQTQHLIQYLSPTSTPDNNNNSTRVHNPSIVVSSSNNGLPPVSYYSPQNLGDLSRGQADGGMEQQFATAQSTSQAPPTSTHGQTATPASGEDYMPNVDFIVPNSFQFTSHADSNPPQQRLDNGYMVRELTYNEW